MLIPKPIYNTTNDYYILHNGGYTFPMAGNELYITEDDYYLIMHGSEPHDNLIDGLIYRKNNDASYITLINYYLHLENYPILGILIGSNEIYDPTPNVYLGDAPQHLGKANYKSILDFYFYGNLLYLKKVNYNTMLDFYLNNLLQLWKENYNRTVDYYLGRLRYLLGLWKVNYNINTNYYLGKLWRLLDHNYNVTDDYYLGSTEHTFFNAYNITTDCYLGNKLHPLERDYEIDTNYYLVKSGGLSHKNLHREIPYIPLKLAGLANMLGVNIIPPYIDISLFNLPIFKMADYYLWGPLIVLFTPNLSPLNKLEYNISKDRIVYKILGENAKIFGLYTGRDYFIRSNWDGNITPNLNPQSRLLHIKLQPAENKYALKVLLKYKLITTNKKFKRPASLSLYSDTNEAIASRKKEVVMILKYNYDTKDVRVNFNTYKESHIQSLLTSIIDLKTVDTTILSAIKQDSSGALNNEYNLIKFYIEDVYSQKLITMPAYLETLNDVGGTAKILTINYVNGIYPKFLYTGVLVRKILFSFKLVCSSRALLKNYAQKMNYMRSLTYPNFNTNNKNIRFPIAPLVKLTIGDIISEVYGMFLSIIPKWEVKNTPWNIDTLDFARKGELFLQLSEAKSMQIPYIATVECSFIMMHYDGQQVGGRHYNLPENWLKYEDGEWKYNDSVGTTFEEYNNGSI